MHNFMTRGTAALLLALVAVVSLMPGGCVFIRRGPPLQERQAALNAPHEEGKPLEVRARNGSVTVRRASGAEVAIHATLRMTSQERLSATTIAANRQPDGTLLVEAVPPDGGWVSNEGCSFEIAAPDVSGVRISASNGKIDIEGLAGGASLTSTNASVVVRAHQGPLTVSTSNGSVKIIDAHGPVDARTSNGSVEVSFADDAPGPLAAATSNGSVEARLGRAYRGTLEMSTSNGKVRLPEGDGIRVHRKARTSASISVGEGGASTQIRTSNGSIRIRL